jgi:hypothetical protein
MADLDMTLTDTQVRKWGRARVGISDYGAAGITPPTEPSELFDSTTYKPKVFPTGVKELGYVTTDGFTAGRSISTSDTTMLQSNVPVRSDVESVTHTIKFALGEANNFVNALYHGLKVASFGASKDAAWLYADDALSGAYENEYVLWLYFVDGSGTRAVYRGEIGYRVKITAIDDRSMKRTDPEVFSFTFGAYGDPVTGKSILRGQDGPGLTTHLTYTP